VAEICQNKRKTVYVYVPKKKQKVMMRKLFFVAFLLLCSNAYSQKHQISAGMGLASSN